MLMTLELQAEPRAVIRCGRGRCRQLLLELTKLKEGDDGWPIDPTGLANMAKEHMPECRPGMTTIGGTSAA
jgi:hypothetical protein